MATVKAIRVGNHKVYAPGHTVSLISDGTVVFSGGCVAVPNIGQVICNCGGIITIDTIPAGFEEEKPLDRTFRLSKLEISDLPEVRVHVWDKQGEIHVKAPAGVKFDSTGDWLTIYMEQEAVSMNFGDVNVTSIRNCSGVVIGRGNRVNISGGDIVGRNVHTSSIETEEVEPVEIWVPMGCPIVSKEVATLKVDDTCGDLSVNSSGSTDVKTGMIAGLEVDLSGSGEVVSSYVKGDIDFRCSGNGKLKVMAGEIGTCKIKISGSGNVILRTSVQYLRGKISGSGNVIVNSCATRPDFKISGSGDVTVLN